MLNRCARATAAIQLCLLIRAVTVTSLSPVHPTSLSCRTDAHSTTAFNGRTSTSLFGVRSTLSRARDSIFSKDRSDADLKDGIAFFYDRSSKLWEDVWGEHMHHGYYVPEDRTVSCLKIWCDDTHELESPIHKHLIFFVDRIMSKRKLT